MSDYPVNPGVRVGDVLAGKYRVDRVLGAGGMGVVVAAHHIQLDERVAIKFLLPEALGSPDAVARFDREARAAVKIKSEHVARVSDVGRLETGAPYMVMEYLEGEDLSAWLRNRGPMSFDQAGEFVLQACEAIAEAHALGIVHRDLKPSNLFCVRRADGILAIKVLDFGISKVTSPAGSDPALAMTRTHAVIGSPFYMSPEQMRSARDVDARADIWSLGVILFQLVSAHLPFEAETLPELVLRITNEPPGALRSVRPDAPARFEQVVARCLEKNRERRFHHVGELAEALGEFVPARAKGSVERIQRTMQAAGIRGAPPVSQLARTVEDGPGVAAVSAGSAGSAPAGTLSSWGRTASGPRTKRTALLASIAAGVLLLAGGGLLIAKRWARSAPAAAIAPSGTEPARAAEPPSAAATLAETTAPAPSAPSATSDAPAGASAASAPSATSNVAPRTPATNAPTAPASPHRAGAPTSPAPPPPAPSPSPSPAPAPKANCNPPYFIDSAGHKQYKPECF